MKKSSDETLSMSAGSRGCAGWPPRSSGSVPTAAGSGIQRLQRRTADPECRDLGRSMRGHARRARALRRRSRLLASGPWRPDRQEIRDGRAVFEAHMPRAWTVQRRPPQRPRAWPGTGTVPGGDRYPSMMPGAGERTRPEPQGPHSGRGSQRKRRTAMTAPAMPQAASTARSRQSAPACWANGPVRAWLNGRTGSQPATRLSSAEWIGR